MSRMPFLEDFETAGAEPAAMAGPTEDWRDGHAHGFAAGLAHAAASQTQLSDEIAQTLADMAFGYAEARTHLLDALKPLFGILIGKVLPAFADQSLTGHLVELIQQAADQDSAAALELSVHPDRLAGLADLLPHAVGLPVILVADPSLGPGGAVLTSARGETALDLDALIARASAALGVMFETDDERASYG